MGIKRIFHNITLLYYAILGGLMLAWGVIFILEKEGELVSSVEFSMLITFKWIAIILGVSGITLSHLFYKRYMTSIFLDKELSMAKKLEKFKISMLIKLAILEFSGMVALVFYVLIQDIIFQGVFMVVLLVMMLSRPSLKRISTDLGLDQKEEKVLINHIYS